MCQIVTGVSGVSMMFGSGQVIFVAGFGPYHTCYWIWVRSTCYWMWVGSHIIDMSQIILLVTGFWIGHTYYWICIKPNLIQRIYQFTLVKLYCKRKVSYSLYIYLQNNNSWNKIQMDSCVSNRLIHHRLQTNNERKVNVGKNEIVLSEFYL